jgi:hypothetical protein
MMNPVVQIFASTVVESGPLIPAFSPSGGEGGRRPDEGARPEMVSNSLFIVIFDFSAR